MTTRSAPFSICPLNWGLPTGGTGGEFQNLDNAMMTVNGNTSLPNWIPTGLFEGSYSGYYLSNLAGQGNNGYYWSSSAGSATNSYNLNFNVSDAPPSSNNSKRYGFALPCVASLIKLMLK